MKREKPERKRICNANTPQTGPGGPKNEKPETPGKEIDRPIAPA